MKVSSRWTKWQIAIVIAMIVVYLFQEVKESPEFLAAVREAANAKLPIVPVTIQPRQDSSSSEPLDKNAPAKMERTGRSRDQLNETDDSFSQSLSQIKPHTKSRAS
ncbi:hypothetical protein [Paenibacillus qinlingensis]|uniref:Uncharacterized protein n=1 Tax=Paenibacillus qinlingensis TaxID=1837343 RepID=A0ABU1NZL6_9BACL|nr:hypothetical protein [Paenibacillus qinlingensis]MDR6552943.1 hypothetical protein [Paenibacillus qinlingensis]